MRQFAGVIAGFVVLTIALIFLARHIQPDSSVDANPSQGVLAEKRITPEASVRYGYEAAAALAEAQAAAASPAIVDLFSTGERLPAARIEDCRANLTPPGHRDATALDPWWLITLSGLALLIRRWRAYGLQ